MIETLGEALDAGWLVTIRCGWGRRDGLKQIRECKASHTADLVTLVWTRGRDFPLVRLEQRLKCPRCGSRRVLVGFFPPAASCAAWAAARP